MSLDLRYSNVLDKCVDSLKIWKSFITDNLEGDEKNSEMEKLEQITKNYMSLHNNYQKSKNALKAVEETLANNEENQDIDTLYNEILPNQTFDKEFAKEEIWSSIFSNRQSVQEVKQKSSKLKDSQYDVVSANDSIMCSNVFTPPIDPISKVIIAHPVTNKKCKHVYERDTIYDYMKQRKQRTKCPYIGCKNEKVIPNDLVEDAELKERITQYLETQSQEESQTEDDDSDC